MPASVIFKSHPHPLTKCDQTLFRCHHCGVEGSGLAYQCKSCVDVLYFHPRCCIDDKDVDLTTEDSAILAYVRSMARSVGLADRRAAVAMDGACGQTKAMVGTPSQPGVIIRCLLPKKIDVAKGSAQCSPSQNPLDCMRSFLMSKADKCNWTHSNATGASQSMILFIDNVFKKVMKDCSTSDQNTFILSLMHLESTISKNFCRPVMQKGWEVAGLIDLSFHKVMSHWLGYVHLRPEDVNGLLGLLPAFLYEMATTFSLSDRSMAAMQKFFPADFKSYPTDRNLLGLPRQRAALVSWLVELHNRQAVAVIEADDVTGPEERPSDPPMDAKGLAVCPCSKQGFKGRHYANTEDGWQKHCGTQSHKNWRARETAASTSAQSAAMLASDMEWMKRPDTVKLLAICQELGVNAAIGKKFIAFKLKDCDLPAIRHFTFDRMLETFSLAQGQVLMMRQRIDALAQPAPPAAMDARLPRASVAAATLHPIPRPFVLLQQGSAPVAEPLPISAPSAVATAAAVPSVQGRTLGGQFAKIKKPAVGRGGGGQ